jgi:hypothetical protein
MNKLYTDSNEVSCQVVPMVLGTLAINNWFELVNLEIYYICSAILN